jgi:outer membrane protein OmpA-like peptidoglycan-associated protein
MRSNRFAGASRLVLAAAMAPSLAHAEDAGFDAHGFNLVAFDQQTLGHLTVQDPFITKGFFGGALFEYASAPLMRVTVPAGGAIEDAKWKALLDNVMALNLDAGWAPSKNLRLDVAMPLFLASTREDGLDNGAGMGDMRVSGALAFQGKDGLGFGAGVVPYIDIPVGGGAAYYLGSSQVAGGARAMLGFRTERLLASLEAGAHLGAPTELDVTEGAASFRVGLGVGYAVTDALGFGAEAHTTLPGSETHLFVGSPAPTEALAHGTLRTKMGLAFTLGGAMGLSDGPGTATYRAFLGLGWSPSGSTAAPVVVNKDRDGDGIEDSVDACPEQPETKNGVKDQDGCPDELPTVMVMGKVDGALVPATVAVAGADGNPVQGLATVKLEKVAVGSVWHGKATWQCYQGELDFKVDEAGSPAEIAMKPVLDAKVTISVTGSNGKPAGEATIKWDRDASLGCVPADHKGKLAGGKMEAAIGAGDHRVFITAPGATTVSQVVTAKAGESVSVTARLEKTKVDLQEKQLKILDVVLFETNKADIKAASFKLLDEVAATIMANPQVGRVEIGGHTDNVGKPDYNKQLSQDRANSVKLYLESRGLKAERLVAVGYGDAKPIADNKKEKGRSANRRVEFNFVDQAPPPPPPGPAPNMAPPSEPAPPGPAPNMAPPTEPAKN